MIRTFRHRGLERFFTHDKRGIPAQYAARLGRMLDRLDAAIRPEDMNLPGYRFHALKGNRKGWYAVSVSGNLRLTFRFDGQDAIDVTLEDYH
ncbi:MAG: Killer protein [Gammaproteobacteria bacterium]|nr:MAG: Killer protein [Gammaproteobacteria bacterium]